MPGIALILGSWLARESESAYGSDIARSGRISSTVYLVVGILLSAVTLTLAIISHAPDPNMELADLLNKNPDAYVLSLGHFLDLTGAAMSLFRWPLIGTAVAFFFGSGLNWLLRRRGSIVAANIVLALSMCLFIECAHVALGVFAPVLGSKPLATAINLHLKPADEIISDGEFSNTSSIAFYTRRQLLIYNGRINGLWFGSLFPDAPPIFLDDADLAQRWPGPTRLYFVTGDDKKLAMLQHLGPTFELAHSGGKTVFTNRPVSPTTAP